MEFLNFINPTTIVVYITFAVGFLFLKKNYLVHVTALSILLNSLMTELLYISLAGAKQRILLYSISFIFHNALWIVLLLSVFNGKKKEYLLLWGFLVFSVFNLFFYEGKGLNYLTFILGAMVYIVYFIYKSIACLKNEHLALFSTNNFILISSPVMFFLGFSFTLGFRDNSLRNVLVFSNMDLYTFIGTIVNFIYYGLLTSYIFKENKHA